MRTHKAMTQLVFILNFVELLVIPQNWCLVEERGNVLNWNCLIEQKTNALFQMKLHKCSMIPYL